MIFLEICYNFCLHFFYQSRSWFSCHMKSTHIAMLLLMFLCSPQQPLFVNLSNVRKSKSGCL
jgi:hypothetical protein